MPSFGGEVIYLFIYIIYYDYYDFAAAKDTQKQKWRRILRLGPGPLKCPPRPPYTNDWIKLATVTKLLTYWTGQTGPYTTNCHYATELTLQTGVS